MKYLLDTNICIYLINGRIPELRQKFLVVPAAEMGVSIITRAELFYGASKSRSPERTREKQSEFLKPLQIVAFDEKAAEAFGKLRASLEKQGAPIGAYDMLIASVALANNLVLVTRNTREFERVEALQIESWAV